MGRVSVAVVSVVVGGALVAGSPAVAGASGAPVRPRVAPAPEVGPVVPEVGPSAVPTTPATVAPTPPSGAAEPAPSEAPSAAAVVSDIEITPTDDGRPRVRWSEPVPQRNLARLVRGDGTPLDGLSDYKVFTEVDEDDEVVFGVLDQYSDASDSYRVAVSVVDEDGHEVEAPVLSEPFDLRNPDDPVVTSLEPREDGTVVARWRPAAVPPDSTPDDPLDDPERESKAIPLWWTGRYGPPPLRFLSDPLNERVFVFPAFDEAAYLGFVMQGPSSSSEAEYGAPVTLFEYGRWLLDGVIPEEVGPDGRLQVTVQVVDRRVFCDHSLCVSYDWPTGGPVQLQRRPAGGGPWTTVDEQIAEYIRPPEGSQAPIRSIATLTARLSESAEYRFFVPGRARIPGSNGGVGEAKVPGTTPAVLVTVPAPAAVPDPGSAVPELAATGVGGAVGGAWTGAGLVLLGLGLVLLARARRHTA